MCAGPLTSSIKENRVAKPGTAPKDLLIASGIFMRRAPGRPVAAYLGVVGLCLKVYRQFFQPCGNCVQRGGVWRGDQRPKAA